MKNIQALEIRVDRNYLVSMFQNYKSVLDAYGPFEDIAESEIEFVDPKLIWSSAEVDDGVHLINGRNLGPAVDFYLKASKPFSEEAFAIDVFEVCFLDCEDCNEDSECERCEDEMMVCINFNDSLDSQNEGQVLGQELWESRKSFSQL